MDRCLKGIPDGPKKNRQGGVGFPDGSLDLGEHLSQVLTCDANELLSHEDCRSVAARYFFR